MANKIECVKPWALVRSACYAEQRRVPVSRSASPCILLALRGRLAGGCATAAGHYHTLLYPSACQHQFLYS